jgi:hypothetical protein
MPPLTDGNSLHEFSLSFSMFRLASLLGRSQLFFICLAKPHRSKHYTLKQEQIIAKKRKFLEIQACKASECARANSAITTVEMLSGLVVALLLLLHIRIDGAV